MNKSISNILKIEILATGPKVSFIVPITLEVAVNCSQQSVAPYVKLPVLIKKRLFNIFLDNVGPLLPVNISVRNDFLNLWKFLANLDATTSVSILTRFDYPNLLP